LKVNLHHHIDFYQRSEAFFSEIELKWGGGFDESKIIKEMFIFFILSNALEVEIE